jgi:hypothetical protein
MRASAPSCALEPTTGRATSCTGSRCPRRVSRITGSHADRVRHQQQLLLNAADYDATGQDTTVGAYGDQLVQEYAYDQATSRLSSGVTDLQTDASGADDTTSYTYVFRFVLRGGLIVSVDEYANPVTYA